MKPLLYMDIDGVLNPLRSRSKGRPEGWNAAYMDNSGDEPIVFPSKRFYRYKNHGHIIVWYPVDAREWFDALKDVYDVCWASKWGRSASTVYAGLFGMEGEIPFLDIPNVPEAQCPLSRYTGRHAKDCDCLHSKTLLLTDHADGRPFVWVDDEATKRDVTWLAENAPRGRAYTVDGYHGLRRGDVNSLVSMAQDL